MPNQLVINLIIITTGNAIAISIPRRLRNVLRAPSTTPIPNGRKETNPKRIDVEYIGIISMIPMFSIPYA